MITLVVQKKNDTAAQPGLGAVGIFFTFFNNEQRLSICLGDNYRRDLGRWMDIRGANPVLHIGVYRIMAHPSAVHPFVPPSYRGLIEARHKRKLMH